MIFSEVFRSTQLSLLLEKPRKTPPHLFLHGGAQKAGHSMVYSGCVG
jgi:hypothetical protein